MWPFKRPKYTIDLIIDLSCGKVGNLQKYVERAVLYRKDRGITDEWKSYDKTLADGFGDCEDFACLYHELLTRLGYKPVIVAGYPKRTGKGHAICVFEIKGTWMYTTNFWLNFGHTKCKDVLQCAQFAMPDMSLYVEKDTLGRTLSVIGTNDHPRQDLDVRAPSNKYG